VGQALMDIRSALARIRTVEEGLSITVPVPLAVKRVYTFFPPNNALPEAPCFMHDFTLVSVDHYPGGLRKRRYLVRCVFWCGESDKATASDISAAMEQQWVDAFSNDLTLNGACTGPIVFRGASPTLASLEFGGLQSIGLDLAMEVPIAEAATVGP
jgi:hypothetical protein